MLHVMLELNINKGDSGLCLNYNDCVGVLGIVLVLCVSFKFLTCVFTEKIKSIV